MRAVPSTAPVMTPGPSGEPPVPLDDRAKRPRSAQGSHTGPRTVRIAPTRAGFRRRSAGPPAATGLLLPLLDDGPRVNAKDGSPRTAVMGSTRIGVGAM